MLYKHISTINMIIYILIIAYGSQQKGGKYVSEGAVLASVLVFGQALLNLLFVVFSQIDYANKRAKAEAQALAPPEEGPDADILFTQATEAAMVAEQARKKFFLWSALLFILSAPSCFLVAMFMQR